MKRWFTRSVSTAFGLCLLLLGTGSVRAQTSTPDAGLAVEGAIGEYTVKPGQSLSHRMKVSLGRDASAPLDIQVDARGLGQTPEGSTLALQADEDTNRFTARPFITAIDQPRFQLQPGGSQVVNATFAIPQDFTSGTRYADVYIHTAPSGGSRVGVILATHVPILLSVGGSRSPEQGSISRVEVPPIRSGKPINVSTVFENTGDRHFRADNVVSLMDMNGQQVAQLTVPLSGSSMLPGFPHMYTAAFSMLDNLQGLRAGTYAAESRIVLADGRILDTFKTTFEISAAYQPFPDLDPETIVVVNYHDEVPTTIDARLKADLQVSFVDTGKVTGTVVLGRFKGTPSATPRAADDANSGGLGKSPLKHWGIGVDGFSRGLAQVTTFYRESELQGSPANGLFVGYLPAGGPRWSRLDKQGVFPNALNARGDIGVSLLNQNPIFALASEPAPAMQALSQQSDLETLLRAYWPLLIVALLVIAVGPSLIVLRLRRPKG